MANDKTILKAKEEIAVGTMAFHLEKPAGFSFKAGQALELVLPELGDGQAAGHAFSIVSAPHENELVIATRMRDSTYKKALKSLPLGAPVLLDGPFGALSLGKNTTRTAILIAGGIGITPFMSMLRDAQQTGSTRPIILLYSNRRPEDAAFLGELRAMEEKMPNLRLMATMTEMEKSSLPWSGQTGPLDGERLRSVAGMASEPIAYVAGPPPMVQAIRAGLNAAGMDDDDIRSEDFFGY